MVWKKEWGTLPRQEPASKQDPATTILYTKFYAEEKTPQIIGNYIAPEATHATAARQERRTWIDTMPAKKSQS